jgi:hypothetical protein
MKGAKAHPYCPPLAGVARRIKDKGERPRDKSAKAHPYCPPLAGVSRSDGGGHNTPMMPLIFSIQEKERFFSIEPARDKLVFVQISQNTTDNVFPSHTLNF